jgi:ADP-ribosyl-[dinitrogen reductase] hydrolase
LQIAAVRPQPGFGQIGITFCPGKKQPSAMTGGWDRDLGLDLDAVRDFSAAALLTLLEPHEMRLLGVEALGEQTALRHIDWLHLPIRDGSVPGHEFEQAWQTVGPGLRARLRAGFNIVIHCKGGLGRAGMIAARLLGAVPRGSIVFAVITFVDTRLDRS